MVMTHGRLNIKTIIANVIRDAQLNDVNHLIDSMIEWAYEAETLIGSYDTFIRKECEIDIKNYKARLPHDFYQFISFKVDGIYPEVTNRDYRLFHKDSANLASGSNDSQALDLLNLGTAFAVDGTQINRFKMSIENGYIHVSGVKDLTKGGLAYLSFDLDEDGYPLVKEGHEKAVVAYILWKLKTPDWMNGYVSQSVYDRLEQRWYWLCGQARGDDEMPDSKQLEYIASLYQQLLPLPNKNFF
jgi:hypothetical protein